MKDAAEQDDIDMVGSVETVFDIIEYIYQKNGTTISDAAIDRKYAKRACPRNIDREIRFHGF